MALNISFVFVWNFLTKKYVSDKYAHLFVNLIDKVFGFNTYKVNIK